MKADAILNKIVKDSEDASAKILNSARVRAEKIQQDSNNHVQELKKQSEQMLNAEIDQMQKQMQSMYDLNLKKEILAIKRNLIDEAFAMALSQLKELSVEEIRAKLMPLISQNASGGQEIMLGSNKKEWFTQDTLDFINNSLKNRGFEPLTLSSKTIDGLTGAVLHKSGVEENFTLEALLESMKSDLENTVASNLFA